MTSAGMCSSWGGLSAVPAPDERETARGLSPGKIKRKKKNQSNHRGPAGPLLWGAAAGCRPVQARSARASFHNDQAHGARIQAGALPLRVQGRESRTSLCAEGDGFRYFPRPGPAGTGQADRGQRGRQGEDSPPPPLTLTAEGFMWAERPGTC